MANPVSKLTPAQRAWTQKLGKLVAPATGGNGAETKKRESDVSTKRGGEAEKKELVGFSPLDIPELIPKGAEALLGELSATCLINNNSVEDLFLDPKSREDGQDTKALGLSSGEYEDFPPTVIKAGDQTSKFKAVNVPVNLIIIKPRFKGVTGRVRYFIGADRKTTWTIFFDNPRSPGGNEATAKVEGANAAKFDQSKPRAGGGADAKFLFTLDLKGGVQPPPNPLPGPLPVPTPTQDVPSSCRITVTNNTQQPLALVEQDHERGAFMSFPAKEIPAGGNATFISVETPNNKDAKDEGCKGFVVWEIGSPTVATWRIEWDNPEGEKNTVKSTLTPQNAGFKAIGQIAQGEENVPVEFTISGGGDGPSPGPNPGPQPVVTDDFVPPPESKQPTLRKGDKSKDGWVEYLQLLLNRDLGTKLETDGAFGGATLNAVISFQKKHKLQVDGTVGNQTWAALRQATPEKPSTDGRKPHSFVEEGAEARWSLESNINNRYLRATDELQLAVDSVGDTPLDESTEVTIRITPPGSKSKVVKVKLGPPQPRSLSSAAGRFYIVKLPKFKKTFPAKDPKAKITEYLVEAFLPKEIGGDLYKGNVLEGD
jgi:hypothetical protein